MKRSSLSSILKWDLGSIAHDIPNVMGKEHVDPYYAPMLYYSLEKWKEFKKVLFSIIGNCHMTIGQERQLSSPEGILSQGIQAIDFM